VTAPLPCIVCGVQPEPAFPAHLGTPWQPHGATMFDAGPGHYGSTVWDHMTPGRSLTVNVCDKCLIANRRRVAVVLTVCQAPEVQFVPWDGETK
jgi:hypothetical protein